MYKALRVFLFILKPIRNQELEFFFKYLSKLKSSFNDFLRLSYKKILSAFFQY